MQVLCRYCALLACEGSRVTNTHTHTHTENAGPASKLFSPFLHSSYRKCHGGGGKLGTGSRRLSKSLKQNEHRANCGAGAVVAGQASQGMHAPRLHHCVLAEGEEAPLPPLRGNILCVAYRIYGCGEAERWKFCKRWEQEISCA